MRMLKLFFQIACACAVFLVFSTQAAAAVLMGSVNTNPGTGVVDLTQQGNVDWAIWNYTSTGNTTAAVAATNRMNGGTASISAISTLGASATGLRGSGGGSIGAKLFSYSNGVDPVSITSVQQSLVFANPLDTTGVGVQFSLKGDPAQLYTVNVWATGYDGQGTMTAKLNGVTDVVLLSQTYNTTLPKSPTLFTFEFTPDSADDVLTIEYLLTSNGGAVNSHVGIQAVTVSAVPEPSKAWMVMMGMAGLICLRRRG